jgi:predicted permease
MTDWKHYVRVRLQPLALPPAREIEIIEELAQHLEDCYATWLARGLSEAEACRRTLAELREPETLARELQRVELPGNPDPLVFGLNRRTNMLADMWHDLRFAARMLLKQPGFIVVAVLTLALGIGANTAIFSVVNALLLRPLPYPKPEQLVKVFQVQPDPAKGMLPSLWSYPRFELLRDQQQRFAAVAGFAQNAYNLTGTEPPERLQVEIVSASYFPVLGVEASLGRTFTADEDRVPETNLAALLSFGLWQRRFGGDAQVLGKTLELDKHAFTIVGVLPPGFRGQDGTADAWVTMMAAPLLRFKRTLAAPNNYWFQVLARLPDGVTPAQAQTDLQRIGAQLEEKFPGPKQTLPEHANTPALALLQAAKVDPALKTSFLILLGAVGLVLLIACANVANLLLARAVARRREFALRAALGADRWRLLRQLLTESLLLAGLGGLLGVLLARWGVDLLDQFRPSDDARFWTLYARAFDFFAIELDWRVLSFNVGLSLLTGVLFGLAPAWQSSFVNVNEALKEGVGSSATGFRGLRNVSARGLLVVGEIALSLVLLVSAGLMFKSLLRLQAVQLGFAPEHVLTMAAPARQAKPEFYEQLLARVQALPGVEAASLGSTAPLLGYASKTAMDIQDRTAQQQVGVGLHSVSPGYFQTLGIALRRGRVFTPQDRAGAPRVALLNQSAADRFFPGENPLGKRLRPYIDPDYETAEKDVEIVGVVADVRYDRLEEAIEPDIYLSVLQPTDAAQTLIVRSRADVASLTAAVRREVLALDRNVPLTAVQTMPERVAEVTSRTRFIAVLLGLFAGLALLLSGIGIYGVTAYSVSARTREIGIRLALGAQRRDVLRLVLHDGLKLIAAGLALGGFIALAALRILQSQLYEVRATDPLTFVGVGLLLLAVSLLACWLPARRAAKVDPQIALRNE